MKVPRVIGQKILQLTAAMLIVLGLCVPSFAAAQTEDTDTTETDRTARIEAYRQRASETLTKSEERRLAGLCSAAQTAVTRLQAGADTVAENRKNAYTKMNEKLDALVKKLQSAEVDTAELSAAVAQFSIMTDGITEIIAEYQTTLTDVAEMDCANDPSGFKAALANARQERLQIVTKSQELRSYFTDTIKPLLQTAREQLT